MTRKNFAFAILTLLLLSLFSGAAGAEAPDPATPTDLDCAHERTKTIIYFFDSPAYSFVDDEHHRVTGPAAVETVCLDCGASLSYETEAEAEEIRPHSMKKGVCVLCGFRARNNMAEENQENDSDEWIIIAQEDDSESGILTATLTSKDLSELAAADVAVVLVQGEDADAAIALDVAEMLNQTEETGAELQAQMAEREDGSLFAGLYLVSASGEKTPPEEEGVTVRFYSQERSDVRAVLAPAGQDTLIETEGVWNEKGYWSVPYLEEGTYFLLQ